MNRRALNLLPATLLMIIAVVASGCGDRLEVPVSTTADGTAAPSTQPPTVSDMSDTSTSIEAEVGEAADKLLESARLGVPTGNTVEPATRFRTSQIPTLVIVAREVPEGLVARASWLSSENKLLHEEQVDVPASRTIRLGMPENLRKPGSYIAEAYLGGNLVQSFEFEIE